MAKVRAGLALAGILRRGSSRGEAQAGRGHGSCTAELGWQVAQWTAAGRQQLGASHWLWTLGGYHIRFSEQVLVCDLGGRHLPLQGSIDYKLGLRRCSWPGPLLQLLLLLLLCCWSLRTAEAQGNSRLLQKHLDVGVLDQAELFLDLVKFFLLPPNVGLQDPCPLLQLVFNGLEHAELC